MKMRADSSEIKRLRKSKGLSQADVARVAKRSKSSVQRAERGEPMHPDTIEAIAKTLGVSQLDICVTASAAPAESEISMSALPSLLGGYGPLLAAICDTSGQVLHWRRAFDDPFTYRGVFIRKQDSPVFAQLEAQASSAATVSLGLHRDVAQAIDALRSVHRAIGDAGGCLRGHAGIGYEISPEAKHALRARGTEACDSAEFHLRRAEAELRALLGLDGAAQ
jgi:transcriptional regulator with XRE-family HTH domain